MSARTHASTTPAWGEIPSRFAPASRREKFAPTRGLILDLDDTLYPRERYIRSGFAAVANDLQRRHGLPAGAVFKTLSRAFVGGGVGREFQAVCKDYRLSPKEIPYMLRVFRAHRPSLWLPHESAETLGRLRREGWRLGVLTNGLPSVQAAKIEALALAPLVDQVIYAEAVVRGGKPHRAAFVEAVGRLDVPADRCVVVGDDPVVDVAGARAVGLRTVRLAQPWITVEPGADADIVIHAIEQLPRVAAGLLELRTFDAA